MTDPSSAFLCHSSCDKDIVSRLAVDLKKNGVQVWYDEWRIEPGDGIRRKIDEGIGDATHFLAMLSADALDSDWVHTELDGAMVRRIKGECRLIPVLIGLEENELPATLRGMRWIRLEPYEDGLQDILKMFHGGTTEPDMGTAPTRFARVLGDEFGLTPDAQKLAQLVCAKSRHGTISMMVSFDEILSSTEMSEEDLAIAIDELVECGWVRDGHTYARRVMPEWELFNEVDPVLHGWTPEEDAVSVASELVNAPQSSTEVLAENLGWEPRRINPACAFLAERDLVKYRQFMGSSPFYYGHMLSTPRTIRFVRDSIG